MTAAEIRAIRKRHMLHDRLAAPDVVEALASGAEAMEALARLVAAHHEGREATRAALSGEPYDGRLGRANKEAELALAQAEAVLEVSRRATSPC